MCSIGNSVYMKEIFSNVIEKRTIIIRKNARELVHKKEKRYVNVFKMYCTYAIYIL